MLLILEVADRDLFLWRGVSYRPEGSGCTCGIFAVLGTNHRKGEYSVEGGFLWLDCHFKVVPFLSCSPFFLLERKFFIATRLKCF